MTAVTAHAQTPRFFDWRNILVAALLTALYVYASYRVAEGVYFATLYSQDFQWSPTKLFVEGQDPFAWYLHGNAGGRIILSQEPNYLPLLYELLAPFAWLSWPAAKLAWAICNVGMGAACAHIWATAARLRGIVYAGAVLLFFAASPFAHAIGNGQQSLLALFALTLAWRWRDRASGGLLLAIGAAKYSFVGPFGLFLLWERRIVCLIAAAAVSLAAAAVFAAVTETSIFAALSGPLKVSALATRVGLADVMSFWRSLGPAFEGAGAYLAGVVAALSGVVLVARGRRLGDPDRFALLSAISLLALFHNLYDYVFLLPLFCCALRYRAPVRAIALGYVAFFWFVVQFAEPWLKSSSAIGAMAIASFAAVALIARFGGPADFWDPLAG